MDENGMNREAANVDDFIAFVKGSAAILYALMVYCAPAILTNLGPTVYAATAYALAAVAVAHAIGTMWLCIRYKALGQLSLWLLTLSLLALAWVLIVSTQQSSHSPVIATSPAPEIVSDASGNKSVSFAVASGLGDPWRLRYYGFWALYVAAGALAYRRAWKGFLVVLLTGTLRASKYILGRLTRDRLRPSDAGGER